MKIKKENRGLMHEDLGLKPGSKISMGDVMKELRSKDPKRRARGNFARMAKRGFKPLAKKK